MDKVLKQRLVGASILIALAVIFLPMLFHEGGEVSDGQRELALDLPERESGDRKVRRLALDPEQARRPPSESQAQPPVEPRAESQPVEEEGRSEPADHAVDEVVAEPARSSGNAEAVGADDDSGREAASAEDQAPEPEPVLVPEPEQPTRTDGSPVLTEAESEPTSEPAGGRWVVQVAVFSSRETAASIRQRLADLGHRVSMDVLVRDQAELFRLRTGPYSDEASAEQARSQIAATVAGVDPVTRELSGDGAAEDRQGMAVQVGSFASRNNAERLVAQLGGAGFDAFMYGEESGGRTIWRVRVGTYETRDEAERLLETLRDEQGLEGIVVSHP